MQAAGIRRRLVVELCSPNRRWTEPQKSKTLTDLVNEQVDEQPRAQPDTTTRDVVTECIGKEVARPISNDFNFETFIIMKAPGDRYFRSNPRWVAEHVIQKFRILLLRLKDEALCIDYSMRNRRQATLPWNGHRELTETEIAVKKSQIYLPNEEKANISSTYRAGDSGRFGTERHAMKTQRRVMSKREWMSMQKFQKNSVDRKDRKVILNTLHCFPFPGLRANAIGSIDFIEALRYFQHEVGCSVLRHWTEHEKTEKKRPTFFAELAVPTAKDTSLDFITKWLDPAYQQKMRNTPAAARYLNHFFGDALAPFDPDLGYIRRGAPWRGFSSGLGSIGRMRRPGFAMKALPSEKHKGLRAATRRPAFDFTKPGGA
ncbi:hypothetical protein DIPPA_06554 [Diplonema papillatum]|nr:hypothetical protein DIPPA_06554 [Diplonema papillatum]